jgi:hypothetical protein
MSQKNADLPNQMRFPLDNLVDFSRRSGADPDTGARATNALRLAPCGQDDGHGRPLASASRNHLDGLRDEGRQDWFLPLDDGEPDAAA